MAHTISGASLSDIRARLAQMPAYHPMNANTFSDWSVQAGDTVTVSRGNEEYSSPIHSTRMVWRGTPQTTISSAGNKEREPVSKVSRKKYRGGSAVRSQERIYKEFHSEDGYLHSYVEMTESYLRTEFDDDMNSLRGDFEMTASHLRTEFEDDVNSLRSEFEITASHLRTEFEDGINSLHSEFEITASHLRSEFTDDVNSVRSQLVQQANYIGMVVDTTNPNNPTIKAGEIAVEINKEGSTARIDANRIKIGGAGSTITLNDIMTISDNVTQFKKNVYFQKQLTIANANDAALNLYTLNFVGSNTYTMTPPDVANMIAKAEVDTSTNTLKLWKYSDKDETNPTITFSKAASKVSGDWSGNTYTVSADENGSDLPISVTPNIHHIAKNGTDDHILNTYVGTNSAGTWTDRGNAVKLYMVQNGTKVELNNINQPSSAGAGVVTYAEKTINLSLEDKSTVYATSSTQTFTPSSGYYGISQIKVGAVTHSCVDNGTVITGDIPASVIKSGVTIKVGDSGSSGRHVNVTGTYAPALQDKSTVYATNSTQTFTPDTGYAGISRIVVGAVTTSCVDSGVPFSSIPANVIKNGVTIKVGDSGSSGRHVNVTGTYGAGNYTEEWINPSTTTVVAIPDPPYDAYSRVYVRGIVTSNLIPDVIQAGKVIDIGYSGNPSGIRHVVGTYTPTDLDALDYGWKAARNIVVNSLPTSSDEPDIQPDIAWKLKIPKYSYNTGSDDATVTTSEVVWYTYDGERFPAVIVKINGYNCYIKNIKSTIDAVQTTYQNSGWNSAKTEIEKSLPNDNTPSIVPGVPWNIYIPNTGYDSGHYNATVTISDPTTYTYNGETFPAVIAKINGKNAFVKSIKNTIDAYYWAGWDAGWQRYYDLWTATYDTPGDGTYSYIARSPIDHNNGDYTIAYSSKVPGSGGETYYSRTMRCTSVEPTYPGSSSKYYYFRLEGNYGFSANTNYDMYRTTWPAGN